MTTTLLRWIEPAKRPFPRLGDWVVAFGIGAIIGLALSEQAGPTARSALANGIELTIPGTAWQYGLWALLTLAFGGFGLWILSYGGRGEITMRADGVQRIVGKATYRFHPYARMA